MSRLSARLVRYLSAVRHELDPFKVLTAFKSGVRILLLSAQQDGPQPPAGTQMSLSSGEDTKNSFPSTGLWKQPCHNLTDGWRGQNNHSDWDLHLPKSSDLPDHYPLVTSSSCPPACTGQTLSANKSSCQPASVSILNWNSKIQIQQ